MRSGTIKRRYERDCRRIPELGTRHTVANFLRTDNGPVEEPFVEMIKYGRLVSLLPDRTVTRVERALRNGDPRREIIRAGLGYEELLAPIVVDGTAIASSSSEARLVPALMIPANYMQPGNAPGRTLRMTARGRGTTIVTTAGTMIIRVRIAATDIITGTTIMATGAMAADAAVQTATMWSFAGEITTRSVGSAGTVFGMGEASLAWHFKDTAAKQALQYAGSAGSATPAAVTWDMTVGQYLQFTGQWSLATAYSIQCHEYLVEALN
jgi:hypothetical protein